MSIWEYLRLALLDNLKQRLKRKQRELVNLVKRRHKVRSFPNNAAKVRITK